MKRSSIAMSLVWLLILAAGCSPRATSFVNSNVDFSYIRRVAIFPLQNLSSDHKAPARVGSIFLAELLEQDGIEVLAPGETISGLVAMNLSAAEVLSQDQIVELGKRLEVDALFFGSVEEYGIEQMGRDRAFGITVSFSMAETTTGQLIWNAQTHRGGISLWRKVFGGGTPEPYEVSRSAVRDALETLF